MDGAAGIRVSPGPAHLNTGLSITVPGRVTEQVRETDSPAKGEEVEGEGDHQGRQHLNYVEIGRNVQVYMLLL